MTPPITAEEARRLALRFCTANPQPRRTYTPAPGTPAQHIASAASRTIEAAVGTFGITQEALLGRRRPVAVALARLACYAALRSMGFSSSAVADAMHRSDHSTVLVGVESWWSTIETDRRYRERCERMFRILGLKFPPSRAIGVQHDQHGRAGQTLCGPVMDGEQRRFAGQMATGNP